MSELPDGKRRHAKIAEARTHEGQRIVATAAMSELRRAYR
jgi:hypothetical protein